MDYKITCISYTEILIYTYVHDGHFCHMIDSNEVQLHPANVRAVSLSNYNLIYMKRVTLRKTNSRNKYDT